MSDPDEWDERNRKSWEQYERFVERLKACNPPASVRAYEDDPDELGLTELWLPLVRWQACGDTKWAGSKGELILPPRDQA